MDKVSLISNRQDTIKVTVHAIKNPVITKCMENMEHYNLKSCITVSAAHTQAALRTSIVPSFMVRAQLCC